MITNFQKQTQPLDKEELNFIPHMITGFKTHSVKNPITATEIISSINANLNNYGLTKKFTSTRLRKLVNFIRANGLHPVIGSSRGYYTSYDPKEIQKQIDSLRERAGAINSAANGLQKYSVSHTYTTR